VRNKKEVKKMIVLIPIRYKGLIKSCMDCHRLIVEAADYPCIKYKGCPARLSEGGYPVPQKGRKQIFACLVKNKDCNCA
jgi:hypothetical protein